MNNAWNKALPPKTVVNGRSISREQCHRLIDKLYDKQNFFGEFCLRFRRSVAYQLEVRQFMEDDILEAFLNS